MSEYRFKAGDLQPNTRVVTLDDFNVMHDRALAAEAERDKLREAIDEALRDCHMNGGRLLTSSISNLRAALAATKEG